MPGAGGGGASTILDMIIRLRNNNKLLRKKTFFKRERSFFEIRTKYREVASRKLRNKEASPELLAEIRREVKRKQLKSNILNLLVVLTLLSGIVLSVVFMVNENRKATEQAYRIEHIEAEKRKEKACHSYIEDGKKWLIKNHWYNATVQFEKAHNLRPENLKAKRGLAMAYAYHCRDEKQNCDRANTLLNELISLNPTDSASIALLKMCEE